MQEPKTMKRLLLAFTAVAAFAGPLAAPIQALAQDQPQPSRERPSRRGGDGPRAMRPDRSGMSERPSRPETSQPRPSRPDGGWTRPDRPNTGGERPSRPDRPDRPNTGGARPDRPEGGWNRPDRPGTGQPSRPDNGGGQRPDRPDNGWNRPDRPNNGGNRPDRPDNGWNRPDRPNNGGNRPDRPDNGWNRPDRPGAGRPDNNWNRPGQPNRPGNNWNNGRDRDRIQREFRQRFNSNQWRRDFYRDRNPNWWRNDNRFRGYSGVRVGFYFAPGWGYYSVPRSYWGRYWSVGQYLPDIFWRYQLNDWRTYGLGYPPEGTRWVSVDNTIYLIDDYDGYIIDVIRDAWRW